MQTMRTLSIESYEARQLLTTWHIAGTGDNSNQGTQDAPWRTLQYVANRVRAGDTVVVAPGTYAGFDLQRDGTADRPIQFLASPGVVIDRPNDRTPDGINLEGADFVVMTGSRW